MCSSRGSYKIFSEHCFKSQILSRQDNNLVPRLTVLWRPLGRIAAPVAPVLAVFIVLAADLSDVHCVCLKILESERLDVLGRVLKGNLRGKQTRTSHRRDTLTSG